MLRTKNFTRPCGNFFIKALFQVLSRHKDSLICLQVRTRRIHLRRALSSCDLKWRTFTLRIAVDGRGNETAFRPPWKWWKTGPKLAFRSLRCLLSRFQPWPVVSLSFRGQVRLCAFSKQLQKCARMCVYISGLFCSSRGLSDIKGDVYLRDVTHIRLRSSNK